MDTATAIAVGVVSPQMWGNTAQGVIAVARLLRTALLSLFALSVRLSFPDHQRLRLGDACHWPGGGCCCQSCRGVAVQWPRGQTKIYEMLLGSVPEDFSLIQSTIHILIQKLSLML